jgi:limonene 1,2-monooxygenase
VIKRLFESTEPFSYECDWFTLKDARLQLAPLQHKMPMVTASTISPSGMTLAGKHGTGVISIGSTSTEGLASLATQWGFAEDAAKKHGQTVSRNDWRVLLSWHIAETREQARKEAGEGLMRWNNEYIHQTLQRPGTKLFTSPDQAVDETAFVPGAATIIGTPDDLIQAIRNLVTLTGGFGTLVGFVHDWANRENTRRSWDLVARYVIPEVNGMLDRYRASRDFVINNRGVFEQAGKAVLNKIMEHEGAKAALAVTKNSRLAMPGHHSPDLNKKG